jgi:ABC-type multidrug transport system ATPase subunit/pSer/pThr/pTyr-binding forkhead associated (FHA) protein
MKPITIGRNPESDIPVDLPTVSWNHAIITMENGKYIIEDRNSTNGTALGQLNNRVHRAVLDPASEVFLGSYKIGATQLLSRGHKFEVGDAAFHKVSFPRERAQIEIGRDPESDLPLDYPMISWRHARLTRAPEGIWVEDLDSRNGTYVDGVRIGGKVLVKPGQEIGLASFRFQLLQDGELAQREYYGNVTIEAKEIVVRTRNGKHCLLNPVSLTVFPSELVAVMGPAGSGKTTLLKALNGYTKPSDGSVFFNGSDLYQYYDRFCQQMGYVPQDDIMHPQLTVREAVYFSARLRTDLKDSEIETRALRILKDLDILDKIDTVIGSPERKTLSGGQRKRVNIALELITDTPVLILDEPTSGLSSYDAESVIDLLKALAKSGKTIITTIHQPSLKVFKQFDDLIMISRDRERPGAMVYFGPAYPDSIQFFNPFSTSAQSTTTPLELNPEMLFSGMNTVAETDRTETWQQRYENSHYQAGFVSGRAGKQPAASHKTGDEKPRRQFGLTQWFALVKRNVIVKLRDRMQTAILLLQAPFLAALIYLLVVPLDKSDISGLAEKLLIAHFLMVVAAIWFGCNNAARDIVGEWTIYKRERMITLKLLPYVFSKLAVLLALCVFQCASMLAIVYFVAGLRSNVILDFLILLVSSMIGAGLGLNISAVSRTTESAIALLPMILLPIVALAGGMRPIYQMSRPTRLISAVIPSRWALEASMLQEAKADEWKVALPPPAITNSQDCPIDIAQHNFPSCVIKVNDEEHRLVAASEGALPPESSAPIQARHSYRESITFLGSTLVLLIAAVIDRLRRRDNDPQ